MSFGDIALLILAGALVIFLILPLLGLLIYMIIAQIRTTRLPGIRPHRKLTADEKAALKALADKSRQWRVRSNDVYRIAGRHEHFSFYSQNTGSQEYDQIAGFNVLLPYEANQQLAEHNVAEVVRVHSYGLAVVSLNGGAFSLEERYHQEVREAARKARWQKGVIGKLYSEEEGIDPSMQVELLATRQESAEEIKRFYHAGWKFGSAFWLIVTVSLLLAGRNGSVLWWVAAGVSAVLLMFCYWRVKQQPQPLRVNRVRGVLRRDGDKFYLGDMEIKTAKYSWPDRLQTDGQPQEFEVREDYILLNGPEVNILESPYRKRIYWGRYLVMMVAAGISLIIVSKHVYSPQKEVEFSKLWLNAKPARVIASSADWNRQPPKVGEVIHFHGPARCWPRFEARQFHCNRLLFDGPNYLYQLSKSDLHRPEDAGKRLQSARDGGIEFYLWPPIWNDFEGHEYPHSPSAMTYDIPRMSRQQIEDFKYLGSKASQHTLDVTAMMVRTNFANGKGTAEFEQPIAFLFPAALWCGLWLLFCWQGGFMLVQMLRVRARIANEGKDK